MQLTEADNNKTLSLKKGDHLVVKLATNPSTGYVWQSEGTTVGRLLEVEQSPPDRAVPGAPGSVSFTFLVEAEGSVMLYYARPWAGDPAKWFFATVKLAE